MSERAHEDIHDCGKGRVETVGRRRGRDGGERGRPAGETSPRGRWCCEDFIYSDFVAWMSSEINQVFGRLTSTTEREEREVEGSGRGRELSTQYEFSPSPFAYRLK